LIFVLILVLVLVLVLSWFPSWFCLGLRLGLGLGLGLGLHLGLGLDLGCLGLGLSLCRSSNHSGPSVLCRQFPALLGFQAGSQLCCVPGWENPCINLFAAPSEDLTQYKTRWSTPAILRVTHTAVCKQLICTVPNKQSF
jgi:hypothetical protein